MGVKTPIRDFVKDYSQSTTIRFHMPGHKGVNGELGVENIDITEIKGADYLFEAEGIIAQSEKICSEIFESKKTLYSTEGSSLSIKTMVTLAVMARKDKSQKGVIIAPRNCHKAFVNGCILSGADVKWVFPKEKSRSICTSLFTPEEIRQAISEAQNPCAVYITSPDYLGNIGDIKGIAEVCREYDILLLVDNAHGAYLKFLDEDMHPISLGADMCCDSAHKTLPVLTGGGYLHISKTADSFFSENAKRVMSMYASTSPSFVILQSLDLCNRIISEGFEKKLRLTAMKTKELCECINSLGFEAKTLEPLKISVFPNKMGYTGEELADRLRDFKIEPEYSDENAVVLMISPYNSGLDFERAKKAFGEIKKREKEVFTSVIGFEPPETAVSMREAAFGESEKIPVDCAAGRVCALTVTSCQPSVPVAVSGEIIDEEIIKIFKRYSIFEVNVLKCNC